MNKDYKLILPRQEFKSKYPNFWAAGSMERRFSRALPYEPVPIYTFENSQGKTSIYQVSKGNNIVSADSLAALARKTMFLDLKKLSENSTYKERQRIQRGNIVKIRKPPKKNGSIWFSKPKKVIEVHKDGGFILSKKKNPISANKLIVVKKATTKTLPPKKRLSQLNDGNSTI